MNRTDREDLEEIGKITEYDKIITDNFNINVRVQRWGGCYDKNWDYTKTYYVIFVLNDFKTYPFTEALYEWIWEQHYGSTLWDPYTEKNGVIGIDQHIDGFKNVETFIADVINKVTSFKL